MNDTPARATAYDLCAWVLTGFALLLVFPLHLFSALMSGLLVYELVHVTAPLLHVARIGRRRAVDGWGLCGVFLEQVRLRLLDRLQKAFQVGFQASVVADFDLVHVQKADDVGRVIDLPVQGHLKGGSLADLRKFGGV